MSLSVLGCVVNGPGEARETDIGITGGGNGTHMVYLSGVTDHHVQDAGMVDHIVRLVEAKAAEIEAAAGAARNARRGGVTAAKRGRVNRVAQHPVKAFAAALAAVAILSMMDAVMKHLVLAIGIVAVSVWRVARQPWLRLGALSAAAAAVAEPRDPQAPHPAQRGGAGHGGTVLLGHRRGCRLRKASR